MLVHSKDFVTNLDPKCIQPNAVDIRASALFVFDNKSSNPVLISETLPKQFAQRSPADVRQVQFNDDEQGIYCWVIPPRTVVEFHTSHSTVVPEGYVGTIVPRSTLARNGLLVVCGLYDSGYQGMIGATLHNPTDNTILLEKGCRVGQYVMFKADTAHLYDGHYNKTKGHLE